MKKKGNIFKIKLRRKPKLVVTSTCIHQKQIHPLGGGRFICIKCNEEL